MGVHCKVEFPPPFTSAHSRLNGRRETWFSVATTPVKSYHLTEVPPASPAGPSLCPLPRCPVISHMDDNGKIEHMSHRPSEPQKQGLRCGGGGGGGQGPEEGWTPAKPRTIGVVPASSPHSVT
uniref:Uncharacterized protein n=1 Tax=Molossus molossus TaxID=27622 RepID=A0A7J8JW40_MOLMO|nr:hypothetical protein HJG59_008103 [Molossus molossus]